MTVKKLIEKLSRYDGDMEIVVCDRDAGYATALSYTFGEHYIRSFYGKDRSALVIDLGHQIGAVWYDHDIDELEDEEDD